MSKVQRANELVGKARELRESKGPFLLDITKQMRGEYQKINSDRMLSDEAKRLKRNELREKASHEFMKQVSLRKQEYQHYLDKAKSLAKDTIEGSLVIADDATKAKFQRNFSELKFKLALMNDKAAMQHIKAFTDQVTEPGYASLLAESFHELASRFANVQNPQQQSEFRKELSNQFEALKAKHISEEVIEAQDLIEQIDVAAEAKMFTRLLPGTDPSLNGEYGVINELFNRRAIQYYQEPEKYFDAIKEQAPEFVDPEEIAEQEAKQNAEKAKQKSPDDLRYAELQKQFEELQAKLASESDFVKEAKQYAQELADKYKAE